MVSGQVGKAAARRLLQRRSRLLLIHHLFPIFLREGIVHFLTHLGVFHPLLLLPSKLLQLHLFIIAHRRHLFFKQSIRRGRIQILPYFNLSRRPFISTINQVLALNHQSRCWIRRLLFWIRRRWSFNFHESLCSEMVFHLLVWVVFISDNRIYGFFVQAGWLPQPTFLRTQGFHFEAWIWWWVYLVFHTLALGCGDPGAERWNSLFVSFLIIIKSWSHISFIQWFQHFRALPGTQFKFLLWFFLLYGGQRPIFRLLSSGVYLRLGFDKFPPGAHLFEDVLYFLSLSRLLFSYIFVWSLPWVQDTAAFYRILVCASMGCCVLDRLEFEIFVFIVSHINRAGFVCFGHDGWIFNIWPSVKAQEHIFFKFAV